MSPADAQCLLLALAPDAQRTRLGLEPFPAPVPPPAPVTEERKKEILADARVVSSVEAGRGGRVRDARESAAAGSITVTSDGRAAAAAAAAAASAGDGSVAAANEREAREW